MKYCPLCKTKYEDQTLNFCLNDGTQLISPSENEEATQVMSFGGQPQRNEPIRFDIGQQAAPPASFQTQVAPPTPPPAPKKGKLPWILAGIFFSFFILAGLAAGAYIFLIPKNEDKPIAKSTSKETKNQKQDQAETPKPESNAENKAPANTWSNAAKSPEPKKSEAKDELDEFNKALEDIKKELAESKKELEENNKEIKKETSGKSARVDSPGDGFLALRSAPSSEAGDRLAKIPHGAIIKVFSCGPLQTTTARKGRWCRVNYDGQQGWAYDGYLAYQ